MGWAQHPRQLHLSRYYEHAAVGRASAGWFAKIVDGEIADGDG